MVLLPNGAIVASFRLATGLVVASIEADGKSLTPGFGNGGRLTVDTAGRPTDLARQPDGKLLLNVYDSAATASVRRLNANGTADATFAKAGVFVDPRFRSRRVALQKDGRIIVMGQGTTGFNNMTLVRLWN